MSPPDRPASPVNKPAAAALLGRGGTLGAERLEAGRLLFAGPCTFVRPATALEELPPADRAEICLAGRSNVGKSSLLNALTGRNTLARTSNTPGRTRALNYFLLAEKYYLVDLPGYGYARVTKSEVAQWTRLVKAYLRGRSTLMRIVVLIDSRHGMKPNDEETLALLDEAAVSYQIVLTKADKLGGRALEEVTAATAAKLQKHPAAYPLLIATSAETGTGIPELRAALCEAFGPGL